MRLAWKFLLVFTAGLIIYDGFQDAARVCPSDPPGTTACHACSCGPHLAAKAEVVDSAPVEPQPFASYRPSLVVCLLPESIFHPPKASA